LTNLCESLEVTQVNGNKLGKNMLSKMKTSVVVAALLLAVSAHAKDTGIATPAKINVAVIQASLSELPAVEIPVRASELMKAASKEAKVETAKAILKSVLEQRPQMAIQLVASLAKASPESAGQISTLALAIVPQYGSAIVKAAAASAPAYAADIAASMVKAYPASQADVATWISLVVPSQSASVQASVERQSTANNYLRMISAALAQEGNAVGTILVRKETLSKIIAQDPVLQQKLVDGLQSQLDKQAEIEAKKLQQQANDSNSPDGTYEKVVEKKKITIQIIPGVGFTVVETVVSKETVTVTKSGGVATTQKATVEVPVAEQLPIPVVEVNENTEFPDTANVEVLTGQQGTDAEGRIEAIEEALLEAAEYN